MANVIGNAYFFDFDVVILVYSASISNRVIACIEYIKVLFILKPQFV